MQKFMPAWTRCVRVPGLCGQQGRINLEDDSPIEAISRAQTSDRTVSFLTYVAETARGFDEAELFRDHAGAGACAIESIAPTEASRKGRGILWRRVLCPSGLLGLDRSTLR